MAKAFRFSFLSDFHFSRQHEHEDTHRRTGGRITALATACLLFAPSLFAAEPQIIMPPGEPGRFGEDVDIDGNLMAVSDPSAGTVHVYTRVDGVWQEDGTLATPDDAAFSGFGLDVAVHGNIVAVSASNDTVNGLSSAGAVYIFERNDAGAWTQVARLTAATPVTTARFGAMLELYGSRLIVSTARSDVDQAAYLFERDETGTWNHIHTFAGQDGSGLVAHDVSIAGNTVAIAHDSHGVYLYAGSESAGWVLHQVLDLSGTPGWLQLSLDVDRLAVGLPSEGPDPCCPTEEGEVRVYTRAISGFWEPSAILHAPQPFEFGWFGFNVHLQDDLLVVDENYETTRTFAYHLEDGDWMLFFEHLVGIGMENGTQPRSAISPHTLAIGYYDGRDPAAQVKAWSVADFIPQDDAPGDGSGGDDGSGGGDDGGSGGDGSGGGGADDGDSGGGDSGDDDSGSGADGGDTGDSGDDGTGDMDGDDGTGDTGGGDGDAGNGDTAGGGGNPAGDETMDTRESDDGGGAMMLLLGVLALMVYVRRRAMSGSV